MRIKTIIPPNNKELHASADMIASMSDIAQIYDPELSPVLAAPIRFTSAIVSLAELQEAIHQGNGFKAGLVGVKATISLSEFIAALGVINGSMSLHVAGLALKTATAGYSYRVG